MLEPLKWSTGRALNAAKGVPGSTTDCGAWDTDDGKPWSTGHAVNAVLAQHGAGTRCAEWPDPIWLELRIDDTAANAPPLLDAARSLAPELNLVADAARSRREGNSYILALAPTADLDDLEERLAKLIGQARLLSVGGVRVTSAALCWAA